jgi:transcription elongation factor Elf1
MSCPMCGHENVVIYRNEHWESFNEGKKMLLMYCDYCKVTSEVKK